MGQYTDKGPGDIAERDELRENLARARRALDVECGNVVAAPDGWRCYGDMWSYSDGTFVLRVRAGLWRWRAGRRRGEAACALEAMEAAEKAYRHEGVSDDRA